MTTILTSQVGHLGYPALPLAKPARWLALRLLCVAGCKAGAAERPARHCQVQAGQRRQAGLRRQPARVFRVASPLPAGLTPFADMTPEQFAADMLMRLPLPPPPPPPPTRLPPPPPPLLLRPPLRAAPLTRLLPPPMPRPRPNSKCAKACIDPLLLLSMLCCLPLWAGPRWLLPGAGLSHPRPAAARPARILACPLMLRAAPTVQVARPPADWAPLDGDAGCSSTPHGGGLASQGQADCCERPGLVPRLLGVCRVGSCGGQTNDRLKAAAQQGQAESLGAANSEAGRPRSCLPACC